MDLAALWPKDLEQHTQLFFSTPSAYLIPFWNSSSTSQRYVKLYPSASCNRRQRQRSSICFTWLRMKRLELNKPHSYKLNRSSIRSNCVSIMPQIHILPWTSQFFSYFSTKEPLTWEKCSVISLWEYSLCMPNFKSMQILSIPPW